jgi:RNA polymerase sigma factor (sigma-70 family)
MRNPRRGTPSPPPDLEMAPVTKKRPIARRLLHSQSDERLVKLTRQGRELAFDEIVRRYRPGLVAFARAYAPGDRAEDVVQESLLSSWDALRESSSEIALKPWLYTIVRNRALNARRDNPVHQQLDESIDGVRQPGDIALANEELAEVVAAVRGLPEAQREALVKSSLDGYTHEQIADAIGTTPGGVRQLVFRARTNLRAGLGAVLPLPLVAAIASAGGAGAAGGVAAGTAASAGGGSLAGTGAAVAAVAAIAVGGGVAIERSLDDGDGSRSAANASQGLNEQRSPRDERRSQAAGDQGEGAGQAQRPAGSRGDDQGGSGDDASGSGSDAGSGGDAVGDAQEEARDEARDAAEQDAEEARDEARDSAEAAEEAADEAEDAAEEAAEAEEEAADAAEDAADDAEDAADDEDDSSGSGSGSSGSGSGSSGSGSSGELDDD